MHGRTSVLAVMPPPRHGASGAADLAASHRALHALILPIEGARTYASGISTGAVAVFGRFSARTPVVAGAGRRADRSRCGLLFEYVAAEVAL